MDTSEGLIPVTISLGVAASGKEGIQDGYSLVKAADAALYKAKENGRNRVEAAA
jgi:diguanylate cyclase (GGDEF)-like protein